MHFYLLCHFHQLLIYVSGFLFSAAIRKRLRAMTANLDTAALCIKTATRIAKDLEDEFRN